MKALVYDGPRDVAVSGRPAQPHPPRQGPALLKNPAGRPGIWRYGGWAFWLAVPSIDEDFPRLTALPGELGIWPRHRSSGPPGTPGHGRWAGPPARVRRRPPGQC